MEGLKMSKYETSYDRFDRWFMPFACIAGSITLIGVMVWIICN